MRLPSSAPLTVGGVLSSSGSLAADCDQFIGRIDTVRLLLG